MLIGAGYVLRNEFSQFDDYYGWVAVVMIGAVVALYLYRVITWKPAAAPAKED